MSLALPRRVFPVLAPLADGVPAFATAWLFWATWHNPFFFGDGVAESLFIVLVLEFLLFHASPFIFAAARARRVPWLLVLYLPVVVVLGGATRSVAPVVFFALYAGSVYRQFREEADDERRALFTRWLFGLGVFFAAAFAVIILPVPDLGWQPETVAEELAWRSEDDGTLFYAGTPAWGTVYFFGQGVIGLFWPRYRRRAARLGVQLPAG
jgi:hypothetical protein